MGKTRKMKAQANTSAFSIGNCKVEIHGSGLRCESTEQSLTISGPRSAKILVSVDGARRSSDGVGQGCDFILLNPNDVDSRSKSLLQEVLMLYKQELPTMDYAADTGKNSGFLERCISNGKYKTLIVRSSSAAVHEDVIAAVSYQIVPADTQHAEIPLAAVRSPHQRVGIGGLLYKELSQRLQNVGVGTLFCWADKVSEGFWIKQGFVPVGEVDTNGKILRLPLRADIRRALCFPGGSTLMVTHLKDEPPTLPKTSVEKVQTCKLHAVAPDSKPPDMDNFVKIAGSDISNQQFFTKGTMPGETASLLCEKLVSQTFGCSKISKSADVARNESYTGCGGRSMSEEQPKKRVYETSSSLLKSKRVRCSHLVDHYQEMKQIDICDDSLRSTPKCKYLVYPTPRELSAPCSEAYAEDKISGDAKAHLCSNESPIVMLMNIADETKKSCLTKVVETLGGLVTCEGSSSTHVITGKARRTMNFCIALCSGAWILSPNWLKESFKQGTFVEEAQYILEDEEYKMKYKSELREAVMRAKERPYLLFSGYTICLTKYIEPSGDVLSAIIKASGGKVINKLNGLDEPSRTIVLACEYDMDVALAAAKRGIRTFSSDWFMSCVMKQQLDLEAPQFTESL